MKHAMEVDLLRLLAGELPPERERALRDRLGQDPELAAAYRRLERAWEGLSLPAPAPVPLGFTDRVMARARELNAAGVHAQQGSEGAGAAGAPLRWSAAPTWVRASCAAALVAGVLLGAGLGSRGLSQEASAAAAAPASGSVPALTESYWTLVATAGDSAGAPAAPLPPSPSRGEARQ